MQKVKHQGGCHCGTVRFQVMAPAAITASRCNCSICSMTGFLHLIVPATEFQLLTDKDAIGEYRFNTGTAQHLFCKKCGVKSFYVPRSNPDGYSININCLDPGTVVSVDTEEFDGQNWEQNAASLKHLSEG